MSLFGCLANLVGLSGTNQCMFGSPYRSRSLAPQVQGGLHKRIGARSAGGRRARAQAAESRADVELAELLRTAREQEHHLMLERKMGRDYANHVLPRLRSHLSKLGLDGGSEKGDELSPLTVPWTSSSCCPRPWRTRVKVSRMLAAKPSMAWDNTFFGAECITTPPWTLP